MDGDVVTLALDEGTFNDLNANPHNAIPEYINTLMTANVIPVMDIKAISFSLDNDNFIPLGINHLTVANDDIQEVAAVKEPNCDQELWGEQATKLLLDKYETYLPLVAEDLENILNIKKSASQCENRYKTVLKRKKGIVKHNQKTGEVPVIDPYNNELTKIAAIDDSIEPEVKLANPHNAIPEYINTLMTANVIPVMDIKAISFSLDNDNFIPLGINHLTVANDDIQEVAAVKEPNCDQELWGEQATKLLLDKYETYLPLVGPLKRFKKKKNLWIAIAEDLENILNIKKSASQCENRYKTVLKRKKGIVKHNQKTGEVPVIDPYNELTKMQQ
ncbi:hypothetical protein FQR65_LT10118 [Abscondita terminalis]|nr:hypothetical protein FQR65_LT10118 [Abscondita terminalis]